MKKFFRSHANLVIGVTYVIFLCVLLAFYFWAVNNVLEQLFRALTLTPAAQNAQGFDLAGAAKLDLRGLANGLPSAKSTGSEATTTTTLP